MRRRWSDAALAVAAAALTLLVTPRGPRGVDGDQGGADLEKTPQTQHIIESMDARLRAIETEMNEGSLQAAERIRELEDEAVRVQRALEALQPTIPGDRVLEADAERAQGLRAEPAVEMGGREPLVEPTGREGAAEPGSPGTVESTAAQEQATQPVVVRQPPAPPAAAMVERPTRAPRQSFLQRNWLDLVIALVLGVVAFLVRRHVLPDEGLWLDDAIEAARLNTSVFELVTVALDHPGFSVGLLGLNQIAGSPAALVYPAFAAGVVAPPLLYAAVRHLGYARSIAALLAALLVATEASIVYSGRVKTYAIDLVLVLALAVVVPKLARLRWGWQIGLGWVIGALLVGSFSGFALIAVAVAGAILALHRNEDTRVRIAAVAAQSAGLALIFLLQQPTYEREPIEQGWRTYDGFVPFDGDPLRFVGEAAQHFRRLAEMFPGGPAWLAAACIVLVLAALGLAAWKGREAIRARYLLLLVAVAFAGGVAEKFPFGPAVSNPLSSGERVSLWLLPVLALGLAVAMHLVRAAVGSRRNARIAFDVVAFAAAAVILVAAILNEPRNPPYPGAEPATEFVERDLGQDGAVLLPWSSQYAFAAHSGVPAGLRAENGSPFGFEPTFGDRRVHALPPGVAQSDVASAANRARRVFVFLPNAFNSEEIQARRTIAEALSATRFKLRRRAVFDDVRVEVWDRGAGPTANANLRATDVPRGWRLRATPTSPMSPQLGRCLGVATGGRTGGGVTASPKGGKISLAAGVTRWPTAGRAQSAIRALGRPRGRRCLSSQLLSYGYAGDVVVRKAAPLRTAGRGSVSLALDIRRPRSRARIAAGTVVAFTRGRRTGLVFGVRIGRRPFPPKVMSSVTGRAVKRVEAVGSKRR